MIEMKFRPSFRNIIRATIVAGLFILPFVGFRGEVKAAPPVCYSVAGQGYIVRETPCDETIQRASEVILGRPLQDNFCYVVALEAIGVQSFPLGSPDCNNYATGTGWVAGAPAECYLIEQNIDSTWIYGSDSNPASLVETPCTDQLRALLPSGSQNFGSGVCYIFGQGGSTSTLPCSQLVNIQNTVGSDSETGVPDIRDEDRAAIVNCDGTDAAGQQECLRNNPIMEWIRVGVNFLSAGAGVAITIMVIVGGIQYASAGSNPQAVLAAKKKITSALIALVALAFIYSFLQWLVPGGIF